MGRDRASREEARPLRLFAAVDMPASVVRELDRALRPWRQRLPRGRWVAPENWHVTVKFMGRTWPRLLGWVMDACRGAASEVRPFRVSLDGLGVFPRHTRARVLWAGLIDREGGLTALASALDRELSEQFPLEKRSFTPHLTVARFNPPVPVSEHAEQLARTSIDAEPFSVRALVLYRSHLSPRGARYEPLERFGLRG